jgi:hypothetical protein
MKRAILLTLTVFALSRCDQLDNLTKFDVDYNTSITIESTFGTDVPFDVATPEVTTNSESEFEMNKTRTDLIEEINLKQLTMQITSPADGSFDFLNDIEVYMSADGLDEIKVAWKNNIPETIGNVLELETSDADLQEYIKKDAFQLRVKTTTDKLVSQDQDIDIQSVFHVDAKILGI